MNISGDWIGTSVELCGVVLTEMFLWYPQPTVLRRGLGEAKDFHRRPAVPNGPLTASTSSTASQHTTLIRLFGVPPCRSHSAHSAARHGLAPATSSPTTSHLPRRSHKSVSPPSPSLPPLPPPPSVLCLSVCLISRIPGL